jgi:hypothetical protein
MLTTLDKVRRLEQYLAIDNSTVDPVLDTTLDKLLVREQARILELKASLLAQCALFEQRYALDSKDFYQRYEAGQMGDETDFIEWAATLDMLTNLETRLTLLAVVNHESGN